MTPQLGRLAALAALAAVAACAEEKMETMEMTPAIDAAAQPAGPTVTVARVAMTAPGYLVIHAFGPDGKPIAPASVGHTPVGAGVTENVTVTLDAPTQPGEKYLAMLHNDTGQIGVYEFGPGSTAEDKPVVMDGKPVVKPFKIQ